jgi:hypothetical protein
MINMGDCSLIVPQSEIMDVVVSKHSIDTIRQWVMANVDMCEKYDVYETSTCTDSLRATLDTYHGDWTIVVQVSTIHMNGRIHFTTLDQIDSLYILADCKYSKCRFTYCTGVSATESSMCAWCELKHTIRNDHCAVCFENGGVWDTLACGHAFHTSCVGHMVRAGYHICPLCRYDPTKM